MQPPEVCTAQRASFVRSAAVRPQAPPAARADILGHAHSNGDVGNGIKKWHPTKRKSRQGDLDLTL